MKSQYSSRKKYSSKELDHMNGLNLYDHGARMSDPALGRWHSVDPLCEKYYDVSPYAMCGNNPVMMVDLDGRSSTDYYGMNGNLHKHEEDGSTEKRLILTEYGKKARDKAIANGETIPVPSNKVIERMEQCILETENTGKETGFRVGVNGTVSSMVTGKSGEIVGKEWDDAIVDLKNANEYAAYDVHTHPRVVPNSDDLGLPMPSPVDTQNMIGTQTGRPFHPSAVLGFDEQDAPSTSLGSISSIGGQMREKRIVQKIGYYNSNGLIGTSVNFANFARAVRKINNQSR